MHHELGRQGELLAKDYLENKGYCIYAQNWRAGRGEIDLIASDGHQLVFVEVKTRSNGLFGPPERALNHRKRAKLAQTARSYLNLHPEVRHCRYDLICIVQSGTHSRILHFKDAFWPGVFH